MANWSNPTLTSLYTDFVTEVKNRDVDLALGLDPATTSPTNVPTNAIRWNSASFKYQKWDGSTWNDLSTKYIFTAVEVSGATVPTNGMYLSTTNTLNFSTASTASRLTIDGSGNVNIDSGTFYVDAVNNRVGVGTATPSQAFHVSGTGGGSFTSGYTNTLARINASTNTAGQGAALALTAIATKETAWIIAAEHTSGNNGDLVFYGYPGGASYSERLRLDAPGNLGLGVVPSAWTTYKAYQVGWGAVASYNAGDIGVFGNTYFDGSYRYISSGVAATHFRSINGTFQWHTAPSWNGSGSNAIPFTQAMTLDASGRLGVGTDTPGTRLEAYTTDGSGLRTSPVNVATISAAGPSTNYAYNGFGPGLVFKAANYTTPTPVTAARIRSSLNDNSVETYGSSIILDVTATRGGSLYQAMEVNYAGNLGLGVTPSAWGSGWKAFQAGAYGQGYAAHPSLPISYLTSNAYYNGSNWIYSTSNYANYFAVSAQNGQFQWLTAPSGTAGAAITFTQAMTLDASGNLGVGETSMGSIRLAVKKNDATAYSSSNFNAQTHVFLNNTTNGGYSNLILGCASATTGSAAYAGLAVVSEAASDTNGALAFGTRGAGAGNIVERMRITSAGNVGIGTNNPGQPLDVSGNIATNGSLYVYNSTRDGLGIWYNPGGAGVNQLTARVAGSDRLTINNLGYMQGTVNGLGAGRIPAKQYYRLDSSFTGTNGTAAQPIYGVGVTLVGSTVYEFEAIYALARSSGSTSHTMSFLFGGTATINNIFYTGVGPGESGVPPLNTYDAAPTSFVANSAVASVATGAMTFTGGVFYLVKGTVSINAGGTFIPQYQLSAAPGGAYTTYAGTYFSIWPLAASGSAVNIGTWA